MEVRPAPFFYSDSAMKELSRDSEDGRILASDFVPPDQYVGNEILLVSQTRSNRNRCGAGGSPVVSTIGVWSEVILRRALTLHRGKDWSHSVETMNLSSLAREGLSCIFDYVKF